MKHLYSKKSWGTLLIMGVSILSGCISNQTPATKFYIINPLAPGDSLVQESQKNESLAIEIISLRLPQYLQRPQIVTRNTKNRLEFAEFHHWAGNLQKNVSSVFSKNLSQLLASPNITISPYHHPGPADYSIDIDILKFERDADEKVQISARWSLFTGSKKKLITTRLNNFVSSKPLKSKNIENTVSEMGNLLGELSGTIANAILGHEEEQKY